jgi:5-methylcytosine-specific restriction endonuclease McrA
MKNIKVLDRSMIRSLLIAQNGRCALTGEKLKPTDVTLDHIIPVSRRDYAKKKGYGEAWLVSKKVNTLKGALTLDELYEIISMINKNKSKSKKIMQMIFDKKLKPTEKDIFDNYIKKNYSEKGIIKK